MNKRQKKKAFNKRFGFNPPRHMSIKTATQIMEYKETIITVFQKAASVRVGRSTKRNSHRLYYSGREAAQAVYSDFRFPDKNIITTAK